MALFILALMGFDIMPARAEKGFRYYKLEFTDVQTPGEWGPFIQLQEIDLLDAEGNPIETMRVYKDNSGKDEYPRLSDNDLGTKWGALFYGSLFVYIDAGAVVAPSGYRFYTGGDTESQPGRNPKSWKLYACFSDSEPADNADWILLDERKDDETIQPVNLTPFDYTFTYEYTEEPSVEAYQAYDAFAQELIAKLSASDKNTENIAVLKAYLTEKTEPGNPFPNGSYPYIMEQKQLSASEVRQELEYLKSLYEAAQKDLRQVGFRYYMLEFISVQMPGEWGPFIQLQEFDLLDAEGEPIESMRVYNDTFGKNEYSWLSDNDMGTKWGGLFYSNLYVFIDAGDVVTPSGYRFYTGGDTESQPGRNPRSWRLYGCFADSEPNENADWILLDERMDDETIQPVNLTPFDYMFTYEYTEEPSEEAYQAYETLAQDIIEKLAAYDLEGEDIDLLKAYLESESQPGNPFPNGSFPFIMKHKELTASGMRQEIEYLRSLYEAAQKDPRWPGFRYFKVEFTAVQAPGPWGPMIQLQEIDLLDEKGNPIDWMKVYADSFNQGSTLSDNNMDTKWCSGFDGYAYLLIDAGSLVTPSGYRFYTGNDTETQPGRNPRSWKLYGSRVYSESPSEGEWTLIDERTEDETMQPVNITPFDFDITFIYTEKDRIAKAYEDYEAYIAGLRAELDELDATGDAAEKLYSYLDNDVEPGDLFPNGSYSYIVNNEKLNAEQLAVEIEFVAALYLEVKATNYGIGDVSFLLKDVPFSRMVQEHGGGSFDDAYTLSDLKNGFYAVTLNGFSTIKTREDSRFYSTYLYAGDRLVPLMSVQEDYIPDSEAEQYDANDLLFIEHYYPASIQSARKALQAGHYENTIVAEVTDGTLKLGIRGLSTDNAEDWSAYGYARLTYLGELSNSTDALTKAIAGQTARARSLLDKAVSSGTDCCFYPNFSQTLRERMNALYETAAQVSDAASMYETEGAFSSIYPEVAECQKAYVGMMKRADTYIITLSDLLDSKTIGKTLFDYGMSVVSSVYTAYEEGKYSSEEANGIKFYDFSKLSNPLITNAGQLSSNANESGEGKDLGALLDDNAETFWHSGIQGQTADAYHYLQVNLEEPFMGDITLLILRPEANADHPTKMLVLGSEDGNDFTEIGTLDIPFSGAGMVDIAAPFNVSIPVNYLRLAATDCASTDGTAFRQAWQAAEFQIYSENKLVPGYRYYMLEFTDVRTPGEWGPFIQLQEIDLLDTAGNPVETMKVYTDTFGKNEYSWLSDNDMGTKWGGLFYGSLYVFIDAGEKVRLSGYRFYTGADTESQPGRNPKSWKFYGSNTYSESAGEGEWTLIDERTDDETMQAVNLTPFDFIFNPVVPDDIKTIQSQADQVSREGIYDLMGRKLSVPMEHLSKGLYIIGGKKVLVK